MPELPEVETIRRALAPRLIGARITRARLLRRDIAVAPGDPPGGFSRQRPTPGQEAGAARPPARIGPADLLQGDRIGAIDRRGKRLLIRGESGRAMGVHLGMTGQLLVVGPRGRLPDHTHATWSWVPPPSRRARVAPPSRGAAAGPSPELPLALSNGSTSRPPGTVGLPAGLPMGGAPARLLFRDPRRFGGLWLFPDPAAADAWLDQLGPDALTITARQLGRALAGAQRPVKAALLDQRLLAGVGNIYADEALHRARLRPDRLGVSVEPGEVASLAAAIRAVLREAVRSRGSTLRDYRDPDGRPGASQNAHRVYGRAGAPCLGCSRPLVSTRVAQRATVLCSSCQT